MARIAGSSDNITRTYLDRESGEQVLALAIYGRAEKVFAHSPDACYPTAGYQLVKGPVDRELSVPGVKGTVRYRWAIYMKKIGGLSHYQEAYHAFFFNGAWLPDASDRWKLFRYHPAMFRILIDRPISIPSNEVDRPSEELLGKFIQEITSRMSRDEPGRTGEATPVKASRTPGSSKPHEEGGPG